MLSERQTPGGRVPAVEAKDMVRMVTNNMRIVWLGEDMQGKHDGGCCGVSDISGDNHDWFTENMRKVQGTMVTGWRAGGEHDILLRTSRTPHSTLPHENFL